MTGDLEFDIAGIVDDARIKSKLNGLYKWEIIPGLAASGAFYRNAFNDAGVSVGAETCDRPQCRNCILVQNRQWHPALVREQRGLVSQGSISVSSATTAFNTSSDGRLKEDLKPFDAGPLIDAVNVYDFAWKETGERAYGVVAQEESYSQAIFHDKQSDRWFTDYSKYVPLLLQELQGAARARC